MKTMKNLFGLKAMAYTAVAFFLFLASCKNNETIDFTANDSANVEGEGTSEAYSSDASDVSTDVVGGMSTTQLEGRVGTSEPVQGFGDHPTLKCATITVNRTGTLNAPAGVITIVFPSDGSCKDGRGRARIGTITITYNGRRFIPGSSIVTTLTNYSIGGIKVEGTHSLTNVTAGIEGYPRFTATVVGGKITFLDGTTVTRQHTLTREWRRAPNPLQDLWALLTGSTASGSNRHGKTYLMVVTKDLIYSRACAISNKVFIPVSGVKTFTSEDKQVTINFGEGACDNIVTITINGKSKDVEIKGDGI